jgi:hypothetical protein
MPSGELPADQPSLLENDSLPEMDTVLENDSGWKTTVCRKWTAAGRRVTPEPCQRPKSAIGAAQAGVSTRQLAW